ncbi:hypothetical protein YC2023_105526 [Brassica napus]
MAFNATPYVIAFHDEIPNLTTWNCLLRQGPNNKFVFDVQMYKAGPRLIPRCGQIRIWTAKLDGIYFARHLDTPSGVCRNLASVHCYGRTQHGRSLGLGFLHCLQKSVSKIRNERKPNLSTFLDMILFLIKYIYIVVGTVVIRS